MSRLKPLGMIDDRIPCPRCGKRNTNEYWSQHWDCDDCGHSWVVTTPSMSNDKPPTDEELRIENEVSAAYSKVLNVLSGLSENYWLSADKLKAMLVHFDAMFAVLDYPMKVIPFVPPTGFDDLKDLRNTVMAAIVGTPPIEQPASETEWPVVVHKGIAHAVIASGGPKDGSLYGMFTFCNLEVKDNQQDPDWLEMPNGQVTCEICKARVAAEDK